MKPEKVQWAVKKKKKPTKIIWLLIVTMFHHPWGETVSNLHSNSDYTKDFAWPSHRWTAQAKKTSILHVMNDTLLLVLSPPSLRDLAVEFIHFFGGHLLPPIDNSWRGGVCMCVCVCRGGETEIIALCSPQRGRWILFPFAHCAIAAKTWEINEAHNDG